MSVPFSIPVRIYWEDTDAGGIVYYANYFRYLERARTDWLRSLGMEQATLMAEQQLIFVVVSVEAQFRRPARYADLLQVTCTVAERTRASLTFEQHIYRDTLQGDLLIEGRVRVACVDSNRHRPRPLPDLLLQEMNA